MPGRRNAHAAPPVLAAAKNGQGEPDGRSDHGSSREFQLPVPVPNRCMRLASSPAAPLPQEPDQPPIDVERAEKLNRIRPRAARARYLLGSVRLRAFSSGLGRRGHRPRWCARNPSTPLSSTSRPTGALAARWSSAVSPATLPSRSHSLANPGHGMYSRALRGRAVPWTTGRSEILPGRKILDQGICVLTAARHPVRGSSGPTRKPVRPAPSRVTASK